jgi:hypothetical protein
MTDFDSVGVEIMLITILRPFCQLVQDSLNDLNPKQRCYVHASSLMSNIWTFRAFSILRHEYWLVHGLSTAAFVVLQDLDHGPEQLDTLIRACHCLHEMTLTLPLATDCLLAINAAFRRSQLTVPDHVARYFGKDQRRRRDGLMQHVYAALLPTPEVNLNGVGKNRDLSLQELMADLDDLDDMSVD